MKTYGFVNSDLDSLTEIIRDVPEPKGQDILVKIAGVSINPVDVATRKNIKDQLTDPKVVGFDGYGEIVKKGPEVDKFEIGETVFFAGDYSREGSYQEYELIDQRLVALAPKKLSIEDSVSMPLITLTASELLYERLNIDPNVDNSSKTVLIINGAGGVGSIAVQLAHLAGLRVIATATGTKVDWIKGLGADLVIDHHQDLVKQLHDVNIKNVDYILGLSDNDPHWAEIVELIKPFGTFATITNLRESNASDLKNKSVNFNWEWMFTKSFYNLDSMFSQGQYLKQLSKDLDSGVVKSTTTKVIKGFNLKSLKEATKIVEAGHMKGKVVVIA
ncbi:zinc-binding alcohol dehydrogenase family protein [Companilactobacillus keshanensis]|uniref:Zinc-type alcohol dehydrogenase-like protein n=1 Tax=Companilactobacillus keshanensis TaxID=2486003 RepID=A0ABW4BX07_9LACO|nr:zinc-binding alcohol dehydrogenase family protein [Companilactobacillus keshanensis]